MFENLKKYNLQENKGWDEAAALRIEIIDSIEKLGALSEEWDQVLAASRADTVFLTSDWLVSWWKGYQPSDRILCLAVRDDTGKALGFAPFYIQQEKLAGITYKALLFLGDGTDESEYMDIFCIKGQEGTVFPFILSWLSSKKIWDVCRWNIIPEQSVSLPFIKKWAKDQGTTFVCRTYECSHIKLPNSYEKYLGSLHKKYRQNVRYYYNRAINKNHGQYQVLDDQHLLPTGLDNLFVMHKKRWNSVGLPGKFVDQRRQSFYREMTQRFSKNGWLHLRQLKLFGRPAALQIGFVYNGVYSALQEGFDPDLGRECPGIVLRAIHIQELVKDGVRIYDFLGFPTPTKERWNTRIHYCYSLTIPKKSIKARIVVRVPSTLFTIKKKIRNIIPVPLINLKHRMQKFFQRKKTIPTKNGENE